jgi:hypothetical protein
VVLALTTALLVLSAPGAPAVVERSNTTPTGWGWYTGAAEQQIADFIDEFGMRVFDIEVVKAGGPKFAAALVQNSGPFAKSSWHWYYGLTFEELVDLPEITSGRERALDVERYKTGNTHRYAVITVDNQQDESKSWWWYFNVSPSFIKNNLEGRRIIDLDRRGSSGSKYNVIMIANSGDDQKAWWYYYARSPAQIKNLLKDKKARLVDIERHGDNKFTIVVVKRSGEYWWWYYGLKMSRVNELAAQNGARIIDIERYSTSKGDRHAVIMLNNLDALSTKVRQIMKPGAKDAAYGFYLKEVDGPVYAALQANKVFEPASAIKVVHLLHAMRAIQGGQATLSELITWFVRPSDSARNPGDSDYGDDKNKCAYNSDGTAITSNPYTDPLGEVILRQMMEQSDNRTTDAVLNRFGMAAINGTAQFVGMTNTDLNHRIGCPKAATPNYDRNELTLLDAGLLYEGVADGSLLGTGFLRDTFYDYMLNGTSGWKTIVDEEAAAIGKSQAIADDFLSNMATAVKGGSYTNYPNCPQGTSGVCGLVRRTGSGVLTLPFKGTRGVILPRDFVYGSFVDGTFECGKSKTVGGSETACDDEISEIGDVRSAAHFEMLRPRIRAALQTW